MSIVFGVLAAATVAAAASERIHTFDSAITVHADGGMNVVETITVTAAGNRIKRGIYRDFPIDYRDRYGNRMRVGFELTSVLRDGTPEAHHTERRGPAIRVYIGSESRRVAPGRHTYEIRYTTKRQLGFFPEHDELYWNVTGNEWEFAIDEATATVTLPSSVPAADLEASGYTGPAGSTAQHLVSRIDGPGRAHYVTSQPLGPREGLTIVLTWPKGVVAEPTESERLSALLNDNEHLIAGIAGLAGLLGYYLLVWAGVGKDPEPGVIIARYDPPPGYSPASMRYVSNMGYDKKCFTAAVLNLAVKGYLTIDDDDGAYSLVRTGKDVDMAPGERRLTRALFGSATTISLDNKQHRAFSDALDKHEQALSADYENKYFVNNRGALLGGVALSVVVIAVTIVLAPATQDLAGAGFIAVWASIWWTATGLGLYRSIIQLRHAHGWSATIGSFIQLVFLMPFVIAGIIVVLPLMETGASWLLIFGGVVVGTNIAFYHWLKAPTLLGRGLLDKVEGFKRYVDVAEKDELDQRYPAGRTPELFERYLPYAVALGIEQQWADRFADVIATASANEGYSPTWYHGSHWRADRLSSFSSSLGGSFSGAIAAASIAPGSSSGGGGGGSSGGGGGGGGGGGW